MNASRVGQARGKTAHGAAAARASVPASEPAEAGHGFGTAPVFLASISTILGAILFLRFGYAVGHVGLWGTMMIIVIGHMVTIPTVLAVSEIATNRRVAATTSSRRPPRTPGSGLPPPR